MWVDLTWATLESCLSSEARLDSPGDQRKRRKRMQQKSAQRELHLCWCSLKIFTCKRLSVGVSWCKSFMILLLSVLLSFFSLFFDKRIGSINNLWVFFKILAKIYWIFFCQLFIKHSEWWRSKRKDGFFSLKVYFLRSRYLI